MEKEKLENEKIRHEKLYSVGYSPRLNKYVMVIVITWIAWYNRYFEITEEEYNSFGSAELDNLAQTFLSGGKRERFLFSDKKEENTDEMTKMREKYYD
jgi:hypothetical protein